MNQNMHLSQESLKLFFFLYQEKGPTNEDMTINQVTIFRALAIYFISEQDLEESCEVKAPDKENKCESEMD